MLLCVVQLAMSPPALLALWLAANGADAAAAAAVEVVKIYAAGPSPANTPWLPFVSSPKRTFCEIEFGFSVLY